MSMHKTAKSLTTVAIVFATGIALSGCALEQQAPATSPNGTQTLVTPWGTTSSTPTSHATANGAQSDDSLVIMQDIKRQAIDLMQQQQIDEARIALGILDRMAQRCVQGGEAAACATLQTNWPSLSQQLHKTLSMFSKDPMQAPMTGPAGASALPDMPEMNDTSPMTPAMTAPAMSAPTDSTNTPSMEKIIPMTQPGNDG